MLKKFDLTTAVFTILLVILGIVCYKLYSTLNKLESIESMKQTEINLLDEKLRRNESIIDSLKKDISLRESIIDSLSFFHQKVIIEKEVVIEEVRALPITDAVEFLRENLKIYEEKTSVNLEPSDLSIYYR